MKLIIRFSDKNGYTVVKADREALTALASLFFASIGICGFVYRWING